MRPNILFIMSDDHASKAISAYGHGLNQTPNLDRIAQGVMRMDHCYVVLSRFSSGLFRAIFAMKEIWNGKEIHRRVSP